MGACLSIGSLSGNHGGNIDTRHESQSQIEPLRGSGTETAQMAKLKNRKNYKSATCAYVKALSFPFCYFAILPFAPLLSGNLHREVGLANIPRGWRLNDVAHLVCAGSQIIREIERYG